MSAQFRKTDPAIPSVKAVLLEAVAIARDAFELREAVAIARDTFELREPKQHELETMRRAFAECLEEAGEALERSGAAIRRFQERRGLR